MSPPFGSRRPRRTDLARVPVHEEKSSGCLKATASASSQDWRPKVIALGCCRWWLEILGTGAAERRGRHCGFWRPVLGLTGNRGGKRTDDEGGGREGPAHGGLFEAVGFGPPGGRIEEGSLDGWE